MQSARYLIAGAAGGSTGCIVAYPLDLVKTKMAGNLAKEVPRSGALVSCVFAIMRQAGVQGLYKGLGATLMQVTPTLAINFTAYELTKSYIATLLLPKRVPSQAPPPAGGPPRPRPAAACEAAAGDAARDGGAGGGGVCSVAAPSGGTGRVHESGPRLNAAAGSGHSSTHSAAGEAACAGTDADAPAHVMAPPRVQAVPVVQAACRAPIAPMIATIAASRQEDTGTPRLRGTAPAAVSARGGAGVSADAITQRAFVSLVAGTVSGVVSSTMTFPLDVVRRRVQFAPDVTYAQVRHACQPCVPDP